MTRGEMSPSSENFAVKVAHQNASRVAARASILDVRLFKTSAELHGFPNADTHLAWSLEVQPIIEYSEGDAYSVMRVNYEVEIGQQHESAQPDEESDDSEVLAAISFQFGALYRLNIEGLDSPIKADEISAFARSGVMLALFPYAREYVNDVTMRLGLPPLVINIEHIALSETTDKEESAV